MGVGERWVWLYNGIDLRGGKGIFKGIEKNKMGFLVCCISFKLGDMGIERFYSSPPNFIPFHLITPLPT